MKPKLFVFFFVLHLILTYAVPMVLSLGFFVESTRVYTKILAVLIFPVKISEILGYPLDGWPVTIVIFLTAFFWAFILSFVTGRITHR